MGVQDILRVTVVAISAVALSGCLATGGGTTTQHYQAHYQTASGATPTGYRVERVDSRNAAAACVNDLSVYEAHLQMPDQPSLDLNKPVGNYIREAGNARAAMEGVNQQLLVLNASLEHEVDGRNPFNAASRARSDDAIATIEDSILLNEALAEAISCHLN